ncbi:MAG: hypothetical protein JWO52_3317 [Gammaproteobacteria bacterium]|nr:hypothetical protein [Gammaproteobacteria bacterium]
MTPTPKSASGATARQGAVEQAKPQGAAGPFVLNLCSSTTPMALSNPEQAELKRFTFFVSRRFEEGRERFRLHMGYFQSLADAEEWLGAVRDIYPGAWAGEAPGKKLRERAVAAAAAQAQHAAGPPPLVVPTAQQAPPSRNVPTLAVAPTPSVPALNVPTIHAATPPARAAAPVPAQIPRNVPLAKPAPALNSAPAAKPAPVAARVPLAAHAAAPSVIGTMRVPKAAPVGPVAAPRPTAPSQPRAGAPFTAMAPAPAPAARPAAPIVGRPAVPAVARTAPAAAPAARAAQPARPAAPSHPQPTVAQALTGRTHGASAGPGRPMAKANVKPTLPNSNVREVLKALDEVPTETETTGQTRMMPAPMLARLDAVSDDNNFSDTQVLNFLETRRADGTELTGVDVETGAISLLKPDDTGTRRALKEAVADNAPVWFAVQLQWSVQPVELSKVPPLAIFSAYTLYTVEGSRDGRKWYGLRLGFFSDAISAKQVAYYVRSEFTAVAVVPVSPQERTRASDVDKKAEMSFPKRPRQAPVDEFKLIDSDEHQPAAARPRQAAAVKPVAPARTAAPVAAAARRAPKANGRVRAREARTPQTLEETLEILGAGELEMDNGTGETMNQSGVRHLRVEVQKNTPFGRLLERLSERVRKP